MKLVNVISTLFIGLSVWGCCGHSDKAENIRVRGQRFIDSQQRTVIWNGLNLVEKNPEVGYLNPQDETLFRQFRMWGVNCVRYGIHWDGLEPEPGEINEEYLKEIDKRVYWARINGISLILDMHQDLYSRKFGNGAAAWATLDEGFPHITGEVWSDAYLMSPAVHKSFDNFWANAPASDGVGVQDHYIEVWKKVAAYLPHAASSIVHLSPETGFRIISLGEHTSAGYLEIQPCGGKRSLKVNNCIFF